MNSRRNRARYRWTRDSGNGTGALSEFRVRHDASLFGLELDIEELPEELTDQMAPIPFIAPASVSEALHAFGLPQSELSPDEELIDLLVNAAEIEQGLMIQYLFAAATAGKTDLANYLSTLAVEEMGHFMTVQNLLVAFGAEPHLHHSDWVETDFFKPFDFRLEPASKASVAKYTITEMPDEHSSDIDPEQRADLPAILLDAAKSTSLSGVAPHRVGLLYLKIYWLLRSNDSPLPAGQTEPWVNFPIETAATEFPNFHISDGLFREERIARLGLLNDWSAPGRDLKIRKLMGRSDALQAIAEISAQGEGFGTSADGHFDKLVRAWRLPDSEYPGATSFASNPWYDDLEAVVEDGTRSGDKITNPVGVAFARMGDKAYEIVVMTIALSLLLPEQVSAEARSSVVYASIDCMRLCLLPCINMLARTQVSSDSTAPRKFCGLPYLQNPMIVPSDLASVRSRIEKLKDEIITIAADVQKIPGASIPVKNTAKTISGKLSGNVWPPVDRVAI